MGEVFSQALTVEGVPKAILQDAAMMPL